MGTSAFYYSPHPDVTKVATQTIDLGEIISDLQITPYRISHDAVSMSGRLSRVTRRVGLRARIVHERFNDNALAEKLYTMGDHLERGGAVSFTVDTDKCYAAFALGTVEAYYDSGSTRRYKMGAPLFDSYSATAPAAGDVLFVESFGAGAKREEVRVSAYNSSTRIMTLAAPLKYNHTGTLMFRHRDFFPVLFRPAAANEQPLLTHDHRISWTWDGTLECYSGHLLELYYSGKDTDTGLDFKVSGPATPGTISTGDESLTLPDDWTMSEEGLRTEGSAIADIIDMMGKL